MVGLFLLRDTPVKSSRGGQVCYAPMKWALHFIGQAFNWAGGLTPLSVDFISISIVFLVVSIVESYSNT